MGGNVSELVFDNYADDYYSYSPYSNPKGPLSFIADYCVKRGGNFNSKYIRASDRESVGKAFKSWTLGFRVVWQD